MLVLKLKAILYFRAPSQSKLNCEIRNSLTKRKETAFEFQFLKFLYECSSARKKPYVVAVAISTTRLIN